MVVSSSASGSLKEYLKKYENNNEEEKKKKKKKKKAKPDATGVVVVDEDPVWQKPVKIEEEDEEPEDEEKPQVDEDIEVKRMKRLELLKSQRPFGAISEDGSGWISVSDTSKNSDSIDLNYETKPFHPSRSNLNNLNSNDADISPRRPRARYDTPSPEADLKPSESSREVADLSPQRRRLRRHYTPSPEPEMKPSHSCGPDPGFSPPRRSRPQKKSEYERKNSEIPDEPDMSPPRRVLSRSPYGDDSRTFAGEDLSPQRKRRKERTGVRDASSQRVLSSHPYRDGSRAFPGEDLSPQRKRRKERPGLPDASPGQLNRYSTEVDISHASSVSDLSPPRKIQKESTILAGRPKTGLVTGLDIKEEISKTKKEDWLRFKDMDPSISGRGAEPVYRDKITGERMSKEQYLKKLEKIEEKPKEIKLEWGKGLVQKREAEERVQELELEKDKPFARTRDDPELDTLLKERVRWGDPMAHLVKKKNSEPALLNLGDGERMKESGFIVPQEIPSHSWMKRVLDAAPNRYGIKPGRHWDGVDRSNGYEKQLFKRTNEKQATEREAYLWSVSDM